MKNRFAFTMIELIFVIVVMGIIGKFGVEFLAQAYKSFIFTRTNNTLQQDSESAVNFIASRLQYRIKDSIIARTAPLATPVALGSATGNTYDILEWVATDIEGFRGENLPYWSGIIDLDAGDANKLVSPATNTTKIKPLIDTLSDGNEIAVEKMALYFIGSDSDVISGYGWDKNTTLIDLQQGTMHPVKPISGQITNFTSSTGTNFSGIDVYEYYKLAWTANAIVYSSGTNNKGTLTFWYDYQPWLGDSYSDGKSAIIMENVSTFRFMAIDAIVKIQVCTKSDIVEEYSLCKEKTVF